MSSGLRPRLPMVGNANQGTELPDYAGGHKQGDDADQHCTCELLEDTEQECDAGETNAGRFLRRTEPTRGRRVELALILSLMNIPSTRSTRLLRRSARAPSPGCRPAS